MAGRDDILQKQPPPGRWQRFLDHSAIPAAIDAAAMAEAGVERVAVRTRDAPVAALTVAFGVAFLGSYLLAARRT